MCLADDTCLEIDALNGEPGVYSSRYAGENATYRDNIIKVLEDLKEVPLNRRKARFRCVMVIAHKDAIIYQAEGVCNGTILMEPRGDRGFGYDPLFVPDNEILTFAEMDLAKKNLISHRGKALKQIKDVIESNYI
jgi:XTP/dITP diphosphohydrolase